MRGERYKEVERKIDKGRNKSSKAESISGC